MVQARDNAKKKTKTISVMENCPLTFKAESQCFICCQNL